VDGMWDFVAPNPSRRSTIAYDLRLRYFRELKGLIRWGLRQDSKP
jgi:5-formyltetrahydrofolate cyclo-ligase/TDG/mug DNA glycosylase family protein